MDYAQKIQQIRCGKSLPVPNEHGGVRVCQ